MNKIKKLLRLAGTPFKIRGIAKFFSTLFYIGYSPFIPGTIGTLASFVILWFFLDNTFISMVLFIVISIGSLFVCDISEKDFGKKDDGRIVLDEFVGSFFSVVFLPKVILYYISAFVLFRIFDIIKPFGIKKLQNIKGGLGIVIDDVFAGILANLVLVILIPLLKKWNLIVR